jgi:ankyrin repeat protein
MAIKNGHAETARLLIKNGANIELATHNKTADDITSYQEIT